MYMYLFSVSNTLNNFKQVLVSLVLVNFDSVKQTNCNNGLEVLACKINHKHWITSNYVYIVKTV